MRPKTNSLLFSRLPPLPHALQVRGWAGGRAIEGFTLDPLFWKPLCAGVAPIARAGPAVPEGAEKLQSAQEQELFPEM